MPDPMQSASGPSCKTRDMLKARMRADLKVYRDSVDELEQHSGLDFMQAHQNAEHTRLAYLAAREKLNQHIASHGCASGF